MWHGPVDGITQTWTNTLNFLYSMNSQEQLNNTAVLAPALIEDTSKGSQKAENPESNIMRYKSADKSDPLTSRGRCQAEQLGKELSSTHIDHLISSPYLRALDTARAIGRNNTERPDLKPEEDELIIEQDHGPEVDAARTSGNGDLELQLRTGLSPLASFEFHGTPPRSYCPPGGESLESVSQRARTALLQYLRVHGTSFASMPDSTDLGDSVPHAVVVSHNIFLTEFYEAMLFFNNPSQRYNTPVQWSNASWARFVVFFDDERLEFKIMKQPS
ncbi:phosphoglycerate mutase-like protein [Armillaria solidipes]|uniref:Phosphoglycerate mutase-like protein n=1 Tax=Armillaria solidipes TaxID=1076256 RepID=A0A2H3C485_9AGAR|nr:phosphoglycerate mutase-like protein [Armillaria solidipes]